MEEYTINKAADKCGIDRQQFRKFVGEFEKQSGSYLPKDNEGRKKIPEDFLHYFERASLYAGVEKLSPGAAMLRALEGSEQYKLIQLSKATENITDILQLTRKLEKVQKDLIEAKNKPQNVKIADVDIIAEKLSNSSFKTIVIALLAGVVIGIILGVLIYQRIRG